MARGTLNVGHTALTRKTFGETWTLDETGNWSAYTRDDDGNLTNDLVQARTANEVNEIGAITNSVGSSWAQPAYSPAGNMTTIPQPKDPSKEYLATYDAWNRLVKLEEEVSSTLETVSTYTYDGRKFQIVQEEYTGGTLSETRHLYYNSGWQNLEDRLGTSPDSADPHQHHIWGLRYIDNCLLRDRTTVSELDERLYALQDANWNVTAIATPEGSIIQRIAYAGYGEEAHLTPFMEIFDNSCLWNTTFGGYSRDTSSKLLFVRHRFYHSSLGTWIQRDPIGLSAGTNLYGYVDGKPILTTDPSGEFAHIFVIAFLTLFKACIGGAAAGITAQVIYDWMFNGQNINPQFNNTHFCSSMAGCWLSLCATANRFSYLTLTICLPMASFICIGCSFQFGCRRPFFC